MTPETAATATYPRFTKAATAAHPNYYKSDYWLKDSKYLRLKNIQLGYTIPRKLLKNSEYVHLEYMRMPTISLHGIT